MVVIKSITLLLFLNYVFGQQQEQPKASLSLIDVPAPCRDGHYFVPPVPVADIESRDICRKYGGRLAAINIANFDMATSLVFSCVGPQQRAWIRSWNGLDYKINCLALYTGTDKPGGGIDTSCLNKMLPSVCVDPTASVAAPPEDTSVLTTTTGAKGEDVAAPPEDTSVLTNTTSAEGADVAKDEGEQKSSLAEDFIDSENNDWILDVQNSMYEYRMNPDIN